MCSVGAGALEQAVVDRVAHQVVVEAIDRSRRRRDVDRSDEVLARQRRQVLGHRRRAPPRAPATRPPAARTPGRSPRPARRWRARRGPGWSSRASSSAWIVGGTAISPSPSAAHPAARRLARSAPLSISIDSICSTYSGLPSAAATMRATTSGGRPAAPEQVGHHLRRRVVAQRAQHQARRAGLLAPLRPLFEQVVARGGQQQDRRAAATSSSTCSSRSRNAGSAQWMSSISATTGAVGGQASRGTCARAQFSSCSGKAARAQPDGRRPAGRPRRRRRRLPAAWRARPPGVSSSRMSAAAPSIPRSGQNVMPSP